MQRAFERFGHRIVRARLIECAGVVGVARAADDRQRRVLPPQLPRHTQLLNGIVHRQHDGLGMLDAHLVEAAGARDVGEADAETVAPRRGDRVDIGIDRDIGSAMLAQQLGNGVSDAPETHDDGATFGRFLGLYVACTHLDPPRDVMPDAREQGGDRQADCGDELPEFGRAAADQLRLQGGREHDQGRFGRAGHQEADFGGGPAPDKARKAEQGGGHDRLGQNDTDDRGDQLRPLGGDGFQVQPHADADEEHAERQSLERRGDRLDFLVILGFGDHQSREQRADDR